MNRAPRHVEFDEGYCILKAYEHEDTLLVVRIGRAPAPEVVPMNLGNDVSDNAY